jgi:hypothetical protein
MKTEKVLIILLGAAGLLYLFSRTRAGAEVVAQVFETSASAAETGYEVAREIITNLTRGERNHNPGNIRKGQAWQGLALEQPDSAFNTFIDPIWGIRALAKTLLTYQRTHGLATLSQIISRWAPPTENNTGAYVGAVAVQIGAEPNQPLNLSDPYTLTALTTAIIHHENGRVVYDPATIAAGVGAALG